MKKLLFILSMVIPMTVYAADFVVNGVAYKVLSMTDLTCEVTTGNTPDKGKLIIPATVEYKGKTFKVLGIGDEACDFKNGDITEVEIADGLTYIGKNAFYAQHISQLTIPKSVNLINETAFWKVGAKDEKSSSYSTILLPIELVIEDGDNILEGVYRDWVGYPFYETKIKRLYLGRNINENLLKYSLSGSLEEFIIGDKVTQLTKSSLGSLSAVKKLTIGTGLEEVPNLDEGDNIETIIVRSMTPQASQGFKDGTFVSATLYVPRGSKDAYSKAAVWGNFWSIEEYDGYDEITYRVFSDLTEWDFYDMNWDASEGVYKYVIPNVAAGVHSYCVAQEWTPICDNSITIPIDNSTVIIRFNPGTKELNATIETGEVLICAKPEIKYVDGKISFTCATEGAVCHWNIASRSSGTGFEVTTNPKVTISVYATKEGYINSSMATMQIAISGNAVGIKGDVDGNGVVNVADHVELSKIIMNQN